MSQDQLEKVIRKGESETVELKENFDKDTIETAGAFANTKGGIIIIGVSDKGGVSGIQIGKETMNKWINQIAQSTDPRLIPEIDVDEIDGKNVFTILIKEFPVKPVSVKGRCFKRVGNSNRIMTPQEIAQLHLNSTGMSWDAFPAKNASLEDIDIEKVKRYVKRANDAGRRKIDENANPLQALEKLELMKDGQPTLAAVILFGKAPQEKLLQATVHCGRFKQETIIIDDVMIRGTAIEQIEEVIDFHPQKY